MVGKVGMAKIFSAQSNPPSINPGSAPALIFFCYELKTLEFPFTSIFSLKYVLKTSVEFDLIWALTKLKCPCTVCAEFIKGGGVGEKGANLPNYFLLLHYTPPLLFFEHTMNSH